MFTEMLPKNRIISGMNVDGELHAFDEGAPDEEVGARMDGYVEGVEDYCILGCRLCK